MKRGGCVPLRVFNDVRAVRCPRLLDFLYFTHGYCIVDLNGYDAEEPRRMESLWRSRFFQFFPFSFQKWSLKKEKKRIPRWDWNSVTCVAHWREHGIVQLEVLDTTIKYKCLFFFVPFSSRKSPKINRIAIMKVCTSSSRCLSVLSNV